MKTVDVQKLKKLKTEKPNTKVINVLSKDDFKKEHIPGSINIPLEEGDFVKKVENVIKDKNSTFVVYCGSQQCDASETAAEKLEQAGFTQVIDFEKGMEGWKQAGEKIEKA